jgi:hypothetical protein
MIALLAVCLLGHLLLADTSDVDASLGVRGVVPGSSLRFPINLNKQRALSTEAEAAWSDASEGRSALTRISAPCLLPEQGVGAAVHRSSWMGRIWRFVLASLFFISLGLIQVFVLMIPCKRDAKEKHNTARRLHLWRLQTSTARLDAASRREPGCNRVWLCDTTLRDGAQTRGVDFSVGDKIYIAKALDDFGIDYIEAGGWPGANPTDTLFFRSAPKSLQLSHAKLVAFGMTRRAACRAVDDAGLSQLLCAPTEAICISGKTWDFQVKTAHKVSLEENLSMIGDSVRAIVAAGREAIFDCEHFFDGYKANSEYAVACARTAHVAGAKWVVLCDTNGGTMPDEVHSIVSALRACVSGIRLGIHAHNDCGLAVANSLAAVAAGARQVQGSINGLGERCGNADLTTIIANLGFKTHFELGVSKEKIKKLKQVLSLLALLVQKYKY